MLEEEKMASAEVERRLLAVLQNWVETVFFPMLIEKMRKGGIKGGTLTAKVISTNLLQYKVGKSFTALNPNDLITVHIYEAEATLTSSWELTTPSGTVHRIIYFKVKAEICLTEWEGVTNFKVEDIVVEGSDFRCTTLSPVVQREVSRYIRALGGEAFSRMLFDEDAVKQIAYFLLLHFLPSTYNFLSQKAAEIEHALIRTLTTLPPLRVEVQGSVYTYRVKGVDRRAIKTFGSSVFTTMRGVEYIEDELKVKVNGVVEKEKEGKVRNAPISVTVCVTITEQDGGERETRLVGKMRMEIKWVWGVEESSRPRTTVESHEVLEMEVEKSKESIEQFFTKVVEAINAEEIEGLIRRIRG